MLGKREGNLCPAFIQETIREKVWKGYDAAQVDFFFDKCSGKIAYFGKLTDVPLSIALNERLSQGTMYVAIDWQDGKTAIADMSFYKPEEVLDMATKTLFDSRDAYNEQQNFPVRPAPFTKVSL